MMKKILLWVLAGAMMLSLAACGKSEAAKAVDDQIAAIGEVTLESETAIIEAEALWTLWPTRTGSSWTMWTSWNRPEPTMRPWSWLAR